MKAMKKHKFESLGEAIFQKVPAMDQIKGGWVTQAYTRFNTCCKPYEGGTLCEDQKLDTDAGYEPRH